ncbi:hypothetical protein MFLO_10698 [Listeria floridensis FSL S10-1187]|uniref:Bacterial Ig domain-containing protein n=1 Tax=Listeria floridensis FSL S10-1187 TaxID=1265817 RepID=A0ABP3AWL9_9LIST|nr:Ig-like domain-containing protein [Listeria floridensis]EUJ30285.1 hypothetical protein MFLO_10698 [Listeria floridensis FSL S10-1187]
MKKRNTWARLLIATVVAASIFISSQPLQAFAAEENEASADTLFWSNPSYNPLRLDRFEEGQPNISGHATPNAKLIFSINGQRYYTFADGTGQFYFNVTNMNLPAGSGFHVSQYVGNCLVDGAGGTVVAKPVPQLQAPSVNAVFSTDTSVTGSSNSEQVKVVINGVTYFGTVNSSTKQFKVELGRSYPAGTQVNVYAVTGTNQSPATAVYVQQKVEQNLLAPTLNQMTTDDTNVIGYSNSSIVQVLVGSTGEVRTVVPDSQTHVFVLSVGHLPVGTKVSAYAITNGTMSETTTIYVTQGSTPPPAKVDPPKLNGLTSTDKVLSGESSGAEVLINVGGDAYQVKPGKDNKFVVNLRKSYPVGTKVVAYATRDGAISDSTIIYVTQGQNALTAPVINDVTTEDQMITGKAAANVMVKLDIGSDSYEGSTDADGNFKIFLDHTYPADSLISVYVTDGVQKSPITTSKVKQGGFTLGINYISDKDSIVTGIALPNSDIKVQIGNRIYRGKASSFGTFMVQMSQAYKAGQNVEITATDPASGKSERKVVIVYPESLVLIRCFQILQQFLVKQALMRMW